MRRIQPTILIITIKKLAENDLGVSSWVIKYFPLGTITVINSYSDPFVAHFGPRP